MKKKVLIGCIIAVLGFCLACFMKREVIIYVGYTTNLKDSLMLNARIELDGEFIYEDSLFPDFMHHPDDTVHLNLRFGFHSITINLSDEKRKQTIYFLYTLDPFIVIDFYPRKSQKDNHLFWIETRSKYPMGG